MVQKRLLLDSFKVCVMKQIFFLRCIRISFHFICQVGAHPIPALTTACVRKKAGEDSNVTVPNPLREENARKVRRICNFLPVEFPVSVRLEL